MLAKIYLWIVFGAGFALMMLGVAATVYQSWVESHRLTTLLFFFALGLVVMVFSILREQQSNLALESVLTGGKTFCYFDILGQQFPLSWGSIRKSSEYPLYDVNMKLQALLPPHGGGHCDRYFIGDMPAFNKTEFDKIDLSAFSLSGQDSVDFHAKFVAKNGCWLQFLCLRKVGNHWQRATKVFRVDYGTKPGGQAKLKPEKPVLEYTDDGFPPVDMNWRHHSLLYH